MKEEFYKDVQDLKTALDKYLELVELSRTVGTITFLQMLNNSYERLEEAMKEMKLWHLK